MRGPSTPVRSRPAIGAALGIAVAVAVLSCGPERAAPVPAPSAPAAPVSPAAEIEIGSVVRRVHFAFRPVDGGGFSGGHATYEAAVAPDGALRVTPYAPAPDGPRPGKTAELRTAAIDRGPVSLAKRAAVSAAGDGSLRIDRGGVVVETLRNDDDGVGQAWGFASRPAGTGDLVVRVRLAGMRFAGATRGGLHFTGDADGPGLRYGHATWVGADGERVEIRGAWSGDAVEMRVPAAVVDGASYPAVLDPVVGPEIAIDKPVTAPGWWDQRLPAVSFNGTDFLVVWRDDRGSQASLPDLVGARVTPSGTVLDQVGIVIDAEKGGADFIEVDSVGAQWIVVWRRAGVRFARVSGAGTVLDTGGVSLPAATDATSPDVSCDGSNCLVVWEDIQQAGTVHLMRGSRVTPGGLPRPVRASGTSPRAAWRRTARSSIQRRAYRSPRTSAARWRRAWRAGRGRSSSRGTTRPESPGPRGSSRTGACSTRPAASRSPRASGIRPAPRPISAAARGSSRGRTRGTRRAGTSTPRG